MFSCFLFAFTTLISGGFKGATRGRAKGDEAPPLAKSKLREKIKYRIVLIFFMSQWSEVAWFSSYDVVLWRHKDYVTKNTPSLWRHRNFPFLSPSLGKILVALLGGLSGSGVLTGMW